MKRPLVLHERQEKTRSVQDAPEEVSLEQSASFRVNSDHAQHRARCGIVRHRRCPNPRVPRSTPSAYSHGGDCVAGDRTRETLLRSGPPTSRANKPKALNARPAVELGTKIQSECRAVLVSAKTMPCPNEVRLLLTHTESAWTFLRQSETKCSLLTQDEAKLSIVSQTESLQSKKMQGTALRITMRHFASINATDLGRGSEQLFGGQNR